MSLGSALNSALSGINVSQQQINTISNNVSNATNEGYTRKILPQSAQIAGGNVIGAQTENLIRNVDINLQKDIWQQTAKTAELDAKKSFLSRIQDFHGSPDEEKSISAEMSKLRDSFSQLADSPSDSFLQSKVVEQAQTVTRRINDFAGIVKDMRNNAESEITASVNNLNEQLKRVADLNQQIKQNIAIDKTAANLKDKRDQAVKEVAKEIEISTFERSDGTLVVQTAKGVKLADETAKKVFFEESNLGPNTFYPDGGAKGLFVGGDPEENDTAIDIAGNDIGGRIGAALEIRDTIGPRYQAQIDELAHKMALRFEDQGLRLFTGDAGTIPPDTPPDTSTTPATPVQYVGFANNVQVNDAVRNDNSLVQQGTYKPDEPIQKGSTEVIDRIIEFGFGDTKVQRAQGQIDLQKVVVSNTVLEGKNLITDPSPSVSSPADFDLRIDSDGNGLGTGSDDILNIDLFSPTAPGISGNIDSLSKLVTEINHRADTAGIAPENFRAGTTEDGRLKIDSRQTIDFQTSNASNFFSYIGISTGTDFTNNDLQSRLGLFSENKVKSEVDLSAFSAVQDGTSNDLVSTFTDLNVGNTASDTDRFEITVFDEDGSDSKTLTVDLQAAQTRFPGASSAANQIANEINYQFNNTNWPGGPPTPSSVDLPSFSASVNSNGEVVFDSRGRMDFNAKPANQAMGDQNFEDLFGIEAKAYKPEDPYFEIQVGNNDPQTITIAPGDTAQDLVDKINFGGPEGVPGAYAELNENGQLVVRPGTDDSTGDERVFGGALKITSGPFQHDRTNATDRALDDDNTPGSDTTPGLNDSVNVVSALFGSFGVDGSGNVTQQGSPINNIEYGSDISASNATEVGFRKRLLGPDLSVNTEIGTTTSITRYAERLVNRQSSDFAEADNGLKNEENFKKTLEKQFSNQFGVNIDEELSRLIVQQNAFSASSRAISTVNQLFDELLNAVR